MIRSFGLELNPAPSDSKYGNLAIDLPRLIIVESLLIKVGSSGAISQLCYEHELDVDERVSKERMFLP